MYEPGTILVSTNRARNAGFHPIIYIRDLSAGEFIGTFLTHDGRLGNYRLEVRHFNQNPDPNRISYFVGNYLIKRADWGPFRVIGLLSEEGLDQVERVLERTEPRRWDELT